VSNGRTGLQLRLLNCLETILEMEEEMGSTNLDMNFSKELQTLKTVMRRIDQLEISECDVLRVERATAHFLQELSGSLQELLKKKRCAIVLH
jgi:hypothetical protein